MTKAIEDTLNLPRLEDALKDLGADPAEIQAVSEVDRMANALENLSPSSVPSNDFEGIETHEEEMDEIYEQAMKVHKEMVDMGFNIEPKHAGSVFEPAARFLEIALTASKSKSEQKLKAQKIRMDREKLDADLKKNQDEGTIEGETPIGGFIADRNELLKEMMAQVKQAKASK